MQITTYRAHYKELLKLGFPIMVGQLGMIILAFADTIMVGQHSTSDLAAASFVNNMFNLAIIFATGFSYGLTPIVGSLFGQDRREEIGRTLKNALYANSLIAVILTLVVGVFYLNIHRMGQPEELLPIMRPYFLVLLSSLSFVLIFNAFKQFADGITDTKTSMWILLGGNLFNILGNWILIYGKFGFPELGLLGAGISTLTSRILMVAVFVLIFLKIGRYRSFREGFLGNGFHRSDFVRLNKMGWPIAMQMGMETASFSLTAIMVGWLGTIALAAHQVMLTISQLGFMMYYGMAAAVAVRVSYFHGQRDIRQVRHSAYAGIHLILLMGAGASVLIFALRHHIPQLFTDDVEVHHMALQLVLPFIIYQFGDGMQCNFSNALRGISDVKPVMLIAFIAYFVVSLPAGYFFGFVLDWGLPGIWMSFPFGLTTAGLLFFWRFRSQTLQHPQH